MVGRIISDFKDIFSEGLLRSDRTPNGSECFRDRERGKIYNAMAAVQVSGSDPVHTSQEVILRQHGTSWAKSALAGLFMPKTQ